MSRERRSIRVLGTVPESIRTALQTSGYDVQQDSSQCVDVVVVHARGDWPTFPKGPIVIALCDTTDDVCSAYRAGAHFATPADVGVVKLLVERAFAQSAQGAEAVRSLAHLEREAILSAMKASEGSTARAAAMLDISVRKVQYKLHEYGVSLSRRGARTNNTASG
jgi:DNA-binding NtrC family response regulator